MKSGFVAIIGRPNVGKSTLLNHLVGEKLSAVSPKPQTTRHPIRGILTKPQGQIIFLDMPGLHRPVDLLGNWMAQEVEKALPEADLVVWMVIPKMPAGEDERILDSLRGLGKPIILAVNQIDRYSKPQILPVLDQYQKLFSFTELIPISAATGLQTDILVEKIFEHLPEGPLLFPEDQISDQNERFIVREMISEKLFHFTSEEIPYSTTVVIEDFKERKENLVDIQATIIVEKDSQKAIIIGEGGKKIKQLGQAARLDIERFLGKKVFLQLRVKTMLHWKRDQASLKRLGYE
ncbi:MAG: GTPase Era [Candidatus Omnitrophica bacterium]|nr:GTPase Era [Candidatus Omnitrophota bacterium]